MFTHFELDNYSLNGNNNALVVSLLYQWKGKIHPLSFTHETAAQTKLGAN